MFSIVSEVKGGFSKFMKNHDFSPRIGPKKSFIDQIRRVDRTRLIFYENLRYFDQMNPQNVFYVGKMCTDSVQVNK